MKILFQKCDCDWKDLARVHRAWWMRLFPSRRLYFCAICKSEIFVNKWMVLAQRRQRVTP
jgi:hypothetical protein